MKCVCRVKEEEAGAVTVTGWGLGVLGEESRGGIEGQGPWVGVGPGRRPARPRPPARPGQARDRGGWARRARDLPGAPRPPGLPASGYGGPTLPAATNLTAPEGDSADRPPCTGPCRQRRPRNPPAP